MSSRRRRVVPAVTVVVVAALAAGCTSAKPESAPPPSEVRIGLLAPMSGPNKGAGVDAQRGAQLAADVVNGLNTLIPLPLAEESGLPRLGNARVKVVVADTHSKAEVGASAVNRLVLDQGATAIVGAYDPEVTLSSSLRAEQLQVPYVNGDSSLSFLTERGLDWFFHTGPSVRTAGEAFFSLLQSEQTTQTAGLQQVKVAVLFAKDKAGIDVDTVIQELAAESRFTMSKELAFDPAATDVTDAVAEVQAAKPDVVFVAPSPATVPALVGAFARRQYKPNAVMAFGSGFIGDQVLQGSEQATAGVCREAAWSADLSGRNPAGQAVGQLYQSKFNTPMTEEAASSFTAVLTLAMGINNAASVDARRVRSALLSLDVSGQDTIMPWEGIQFDETHQNTGAASVIEQFVDRAFHPVFPRDASANRALIWPASKAT